MFLRFLLVSLIALLVVPALAIAQDGETIKVLVAGIEGHMLLVTDWLQIDPLTNPHPVPARSQDSSWSGDDVRRFVRIYFPRTYKDLIEFEFMSLVSIEVWVFSDRQQKMLHDSILVDGLGGMQERSVMSMHSYIAIPWADSIVSDAYPNDADAVVRLDYTMHIHPMRVVINTHEEIPPIFKPYKDLPGVEYSFGGSYGSNLAIPKPGAVITSYSVGPYDYGYPGALPDPNYGGTGWIPQSMYWRYGNGTTWTHQDMVSQYWNPMYNPYAQDMLLQEIIFSTGRKLPEDVILLHRLRIKFSEFASSRNFIYSLMDFIDRFGANTDSLVKEMSEITEDTDVAKQAYLDQEYESSSAQMDKALQDMLALRDRSLVVKDRALLWIYIIEWLSVSGVMLISSFAIWTLMVKRRLYREVNATRMVR